MLGYAHFFQPVPALGRHSHSDSRRTSIVRWLFVVNTLFCVHSMKPLLTVLIASIGVFLGSLLSDVLLGDGIQSEDVNQAALVALIAAGIQWWLSSRKP